MNELICGQLVKSKAGRDKDKVFIIIQKEDEYLYLADGSLRRLENLKKKKLKHVQPINIIAKEVQDKILDDRKLTNADIRKALMLYQDEPNATEGGK